MNNLLWNRTIDNQHIIEDLTVERLTLDPFSTPDDIGKEIKIDSNGYLSKQIPFSSNVITIKTDANNDSPYESTTLAGAIAKARLIPNRDFDNPVKINVEAGSYYETEAIVLSPTDYLYTITGPLQWWMTKFYLTVELGVDSTWITINTSGLELSDLYFDGVELCDNVMKIDAGSFPEGAAIDTFRVYTNHGRFSQVYLDNGAIMYNFFGVMIPNQTSSYAVYIDNGSSYYSHYMSIFFDDVFSSNCVFHYLDNGSFMSYVHDSVYGASYTVYDPEGTPTTSSFAQGYNGSVIEITNGLIADFDITFWLETGSFLRTRNITLSNVINNNAYDTTCFWSAVGDVNSINNIDDSTLNYNNTNLFFTDESVQDYRGFNVLGRFKVGNSHFPAESFFGEGGSNITFAKFLKYDGITYTDITDDVNEVNSVTTDLFTSLTAGEIYVGDDDKWSSIVLNIVTAVDFGTAVVVAEYWNGSIWDTLNYMFYQTDEPYASRANAGFTSIELETVNLDINLLQGTNWVETAVDGITKYWVRYRISSGTMTTSPQITYFKLLNNSTVIKEDGIIIHHGLSRGLKNIPFDWNLVISSGAGAPTDQDIWFSTNLKLSRVNNKFPNNRTVNGSFLFPYDLDTSCPLSLRLSFFSSTTAINQSWTFDLTVANIMVGTLGYTSAPVGIVNPNEQTITFTLSANPTNGMYEIIQNVDFYLPSGISSTPTGNTEQLILFSLTRTSAGATDPIFNQLGIFYYSFKTSGNSVVI